MNTVYFLLGANLGEPQKQLELAEKEIRQRVGQIQRASNVYESVAWGVTEQPNFLNQVIEVTTELDALQTLDLIQSIEKDLGRVRLTKWGARIIDIDILYFNEEIIEVERLIVPHPYIQDRRFTLVPLNELAPDFIHPKLQQSNHALLSACLDTLEVHPYTA